MSIQGFYTNKGSALAAKIAGGLTALTVTRVVAGSGHTEDIPSATSLPDIKQTLAVGTAAVEGATATLPVTLAEALSTESYALTELGVYASDPDEGEILMQVYQLPTAREVVSGGESVLRFFLRQTIGAEGAEVVCSPAGILLDGDLDPLRAAINARYTKQETDERLSKKPDAVMTNMEIHVAKTGSDTTGDGSEEHPFLTVQHAVDSVPKILNGHIVKIIIHEGTYSENVSANGFSGGDFRVQGATGETVSIKTFDTEYCHRVNLSDITVFGNSENGYNWSVQIMNSNYAEIINVICNQTVSSQYHGSFRFDRVGIAVMEKCRVTNKNVAVEVAKANAFLWDNTISGTTALRCGSGWTGVGGAIFKGTNNSISGTQSKEYGGQIWS